METKFGIFFLKWSTMLYILHILSVDRYLQTLTCNTRFNAANKLEKRISQNKKSRLLEKQNPKLNQIKPFNYILFLIRSGR